MLFEDTSSEYGYGALLLTGGILISLLYVGLLVTDPAGAKDQPGVFTLRVVVALVGVVLAAAGFIDARKPKWNCPKKRMTGILMGESGDQIRHGAFDLRVEAPFEHPETGLACPVISCRRRGPSGGGRANRLDSWRLTLEAAPRGNGKGARITGVEISHDDLTWRAEAPSSTGVLWLLKENSIQWLQGYAPNLDDLEDSESWTLRNLERLGEALATAGPAPGGVRLRLAAVGGEGADADPIRELAERFHWKLETRELPAG